MDETGFLPRISLLLALMGALALAEAFIPLRGGHTRKLRLRPNLGLTVLFFIMNVALTAAVLGMALRMEQRQAGLLHMLELPAAWSFVLGLVLLDFFGYVVHVLMHKLPWLWRIHRVHHSDGAVDVTTAFRQHPLETLLRFAFTSAPAVLLGVSPGATATYRLMSGINALFEHANIRVSAVIDRSLRWAWVTPHMHKIHHSRKQAETDSNYGNLLSVFDRGFGTYTATDRVDQIRYGLDEFDGKDVQSFTELLRLPWTPTSSLEIKASR